MRISPVPANFPSLMEMDSTAQVCMAFTFPYCKPGGVRIHYAHCLMQPAFDLSNFNASIGPEAGIRSDIKKNM